MPLRDGGLLGEAELSAARSHPGSGQEVGHRWRGMEGKEIKGGNVYEKRRCLILCATHVLCKSSYFVLEPLEWLCSTLPPIVEGLPDFPEGNFKSSKDIALKHD